MPRRREPVHFRKLRVCSHLRSLSLAMCHDIDFLCDSPVFNPVGISKPGYRYTTRKGDDLAMDSSVQAILLCGSFADRHRIVSRSLTPHPRPLATLLPKIVAEPFRAERSLGEAWKADSRLIEGMSSFVEPERRGLRDLLYVWIRMDPRVLNG